MSIVDADAVIRSSPELGDLTLTVYGSALDWLRQLEVVEESPDGTRLRTDVAGLSPLARRQRVFESALAALTPAWLAGGGLEFASGAELPLDALALADGVGLGEEAARIAVTRLTGRVDLALRAEIGRAGENALVSLLQEAEQASVVHVARFDDGLGYDVAIVVNGIEWHLEVKSTPRRGRLTVYLSRNEFEIARQDKHWRLVIVGLSGDDFQPLAVATADQSVLFSTAPADSAQSGRWMSARFELAPSALVAGLPFLDLGEPMALPSQPGHFAWMPV